MSPLVKNGLRLITLVIISPILIPLCVLWIVVMALMYIAKFIVACFEFAIDGNWYWDWDL